MKSFSVRPSKEVCFLQFANSALEYQWNVSKGHWNSKENQLRFLDTFAKKYDIINPEDWGKITHQHIVNEGGSGLLNKHKFSLNAALRDLYPRIDWDVNWFAVPNSHWNSQENQRIFIEEFAKRNEITSHQLWGKVTTKHFKTEGGWGILSKYNGSIFFMLRTLYPGFLSVIASSSSKEFKWARQWFVNIQSEYPKKLNEEVLTSKFKRPSGWWSVKENQRSFLETLAKKLDMKDPRDWAKVDIRTIIDNGGRGLLEFHKRLIIALEYVFPGRTLRMQNIEEKEIPWNADWWKVKPQDYWSSSQNQKRFLDDVARKFDVKSPRDWGKVTREDIVKEGGLSLLGKYNSLLGILRHHFPGISSSQK